MSFKKACLRIFLTIAAAIHAVICAGGQTTTGTISGSVQDSSGQMIAGATVKLTSERTREHRVVLTNEEGGFTFAAVQPGTYTVRVEQKGFRVFEKTGNVLPAAERLSLGALELSVGEVSEAVTTQAEGAVLQTETSEHSALITEGQLQTIAIRGRDVISMLRILPGVAQQVDTEFLGGSFGTSTPNIQGSRTTWNSLQVDGLTGNDLGTPSTFSSPINLDAISEVKVQLNNYQAEYGRNGGSFVNIITKSGSREFHGSAYWYKRHESFNANDYFNNRDKVSKPIYRHSTLGFTTGGPVYIPHHFNEDKSKLFFFYSFEYSWVKNPQPVRQVTVPTELERKGDFSQTLDQNGRLIVIRDPSTGLPFNGNVIPAGRINPNGQAILNIFPFPNQLNRAITGGNFNYQFQESINQPRNQNLLRVDWKPNDRDSVSVRGSLWWADSIGHAVAAGSSNWGLIRQHYTFTDDGIVSNYTRIFNPRFINELTVGVRHSVEDGPPESDEELAKVQRASRGLSALGQFFPGNNPLGIIPQASFGGVPNAAAITYDGRFPLRGADTVINFTDNLTYITGNHTLKGGFFYERLRNYEGAQGTYGGNIAFARDTNNLADSNYAYSNALLGNFQSYVESNTRPSNEGRKTSLAFFAQDNWKVTRRLSLDYGMRFVWYSQWTHATGKAAAFSLERFNTSKIPTYYRPACARNATPCAAADRRAINPATGELLPAVYIGAIIPATGDPVNGAVVATDTTYPEGFKEPVSLLVEPRLGFAYDIGGSGKMALRGSFGVFYNTVSPGIRAFTQNPPIQFNPQVFYGNLATFLGTSGVIFPSNVQSFERDAHTPSVYNFMLGIQRELGFGTVLDVSYVGNVGRHLSQTRNINLVPYGARFLPQNADPANPATPLNDNFFRPYLGWGNITYNENAGTSNYNSLQVAVNRRFARGLQFGLAYTWSKAMTYGDNDTDGVAVYRPVRIWNYGKAAFDQTHVLVMNYTWDIPKASNLWSNKVFGAVFDNWQISGITTFATGNPSGISFTTVDNADLSGGGDGTRIIVTGNPILDSGERSVTRWFDTSVFARPPRGNPGNAPKDVIKLPGINNWDLSLFKNIPIKSETRAIQLRWEMYNAFNHTQFLGVDTAARFDAAGAQVNARFGQVITSRQPRRMQMSLRFTF